MALIITPQSVFVGESTDSFTGGSIPFVSSTTNLLAQDNANLFYDVAAAQARIPNINGGSASSGILTLLANTVTFDPANTGRIQVGERINFNSLGFTTSAITSSSLITSTATATTSAANISFPFVLDSRIIKYSVNQVFSNVPTMSSETIFTPTANGLSDAASFFAGYFSTPQYKVDVGVGNAATTSEVVGYISKPKAGPRVTGSGTVTDMVGYQTWGVNFFSSDIYANNTVTTLTHYRCVDTANSGTVTNQIFFDIPATAVGTNIYGVKCAIASSSGRFFLYHSGTADSVHTGKIRVGDTTAPNHGLDIQADMGWKITSTSSTSYTVLTTDLIVHMTSSSARTATLPAAATAATGKIYVIKDANGNAATNNVTVDGNASETIDGSLTKVISANYGSIMIYTNGTSWFTI